MILILLGTQNNSFHRLLEEVQKCIDNGTIKEEVIVQAGNTKFESKNMKIFDMIEAKKLKELEKENKELKEKLYGKLDRKVEEKEIEGYELVEKRIPKNKDGEMTEEIIEVIYYYRKIQEVVNIDTGDIAVIAIVCVAVVCVAGIVYVVIRNKKKNSK